MQLVDWRRLYAANLAAIAGEGRPLASDPMAAVALPADRAAAGAVPVDLPAARPAGADAGAAARTIVHRPDSLDPLAPAPLLVVLHGCTQTADSLAAATRLNAVADRHGFVAAYPEQTARRNARRCWNWFEPAHQSRGRGEPAMLAEAVKTVTGGAHGQAIDRDRVFLAGFSAGGAMACVLAATYPELFAGLAVHSGLAYGCANGLPAALQAMSRGAADPAGLNSAVRSSMGTRARTLPTIVLHGTSDRIVHPVNGDQVAAQWRHANGRGGAHDPAESVREQVPGGHPYVRRRWLGPEGRPVVEQIDVEGMGHAWSGGTAGGEYADPRGPNAGDAIWRFFTETTAGRG